MSEGAASGAASTSAAAGQSAGNTEGQQSTESTPQAQTAQGGGENAASVGGESIQASFDKAGTDTMNHETKEVVGDTETETEDEYVPIRDYIKQKYKDEQFDDDDKVDRKAYRHIKDLESYQDRNRDANKKVMTLFAAHPELVGALRDMDEGADFSEALALNLSPEQRKALREQVLADDYKPQKETWQQKKVEREKQFQDRQKWTESYSENRKISANNLKEFATENKLDQSAMENLAKFSDGILADVYNGKVSKPFLAAMMKAMNSDSEIAKAAQVAEVKGRNAAAGEKAAKLDPQGDGLPDLSKGGETKEAPKRAEGEDMIFNLVDKYKKNTERF